MPETAHVRASVTAPATTLRLTLEYPNAVTVFDVLAEGGVVEANATFGAALNPGAAVGDGSEMVEATPEYLVSLAEQLEVVLNNVALADVCTFIEAMNEAGTPDEIGSAAWDLIMDVYENVTSPGAQPNQNTYTCIETCVATPGKSCELPPP